MACVVIQGVRRPALANLLGARGLIAVASDDRAALALVPCPSLLPVLPRVVEAPDADAAAALLDAGMDDVVLASDPDALVAARLAALARGLGTRPIRVGDLWIDPVERRVSRSGEPIRLLPREYALLVLLARAGGRVLSAESLRHALSGTACAPGTNVVAVHLSRLRPKLDGGTTRIVTERRAGYRLVAGGGPG